MKVAPNSLYIFDGLTDKEVAYFIMMSDTVFVKPDEIIMTQGDASDNRAYFIEKGGVDVYRDDKKIAHLTSGDIFWELALITTEPRAATVRTTEDTELLAFYKDEFLMLYKRSDLYKDIRDKILRRVKENFYGNK